MPKKIHTYVDPDGMEPRRESHAHSRRIGDAREPFSFEEQNEEAERELISQEVRANMDFEEEPYDSDTAVYDAPAEDADVKIRKKPNKSSFQPPAPPEKKDGKEKFWTWKRLRPAAAIGIAVVIVTVGIILGLNYAYARYFSPVDENNTEMMEIAIPPDSSLTEISEILEENGIIRSAKIFKYYVDFSDMSSKIMAGTVKLSPSMSVDDLLNVLKQPTDVTKTTTVMLPEGSTIEQMGDKLVSEGIWRNDTAFLAMAKDGAGLEDNPFISAVIEKENAKPEDQRRKYVLEGYLFPETYNMFTNSSEKTVATRLLDQFSKVFTAEYQERAEELGMTVDEVVTLASIIEKEAKEADFKKVSAVFHNRLKADMALGSCATHQYFMPVKKLVYNSEELAVDSPYNTYINKGLPAGPICNPGKAAIEAALYPDEELVKDNYLYFCLGDPATGETLFQRTAEEHEAAKAKWSPVWEEYQNSMN